MFGDEGLGCGIVATYGGLGHAIGAIFVIFKQTHHFLFLLGNKTFYFIFGMNKIHNECSSSVNHRGLFINKKKKKRILCYPHSHSSESVSYTPIVLNLDR